MKFNKINIQKAFLAVFLLSAFTYFAGQTCINCKHYKICCNCRKH